MEISTSSITKNAEQINQNIELLKENYKNINTSLGHLKQSWKGKRADDFFKEMEGTYMAELKDAILLIKNYYDFLSAVPGVYSTLDSSYTNKKINV